MTPMRPEGGATPLPGTTGWLVGGGEMGKVVRAMDWSTTHLGPIESWPQSLRTAVSLGLASNFPISLAWGPHHVQIYNDGYWPICGGKHPHSMGQDFSECWASAWPVIGAAFEQALAGETSYLEDQRMFLDRNGYLEETFFTFSFSPIRDETGGVGGLFHPVTETTAKMVGERRTRALRDLAARTGKAQATEEAFQLAAQVLAEFELDVPFAFFYLFDSAQTEARLVARSGKASETLALPLVQRSQPQFSGWPLIAVAETGQPAQADDLAGRFGTFSAGPYAEAPKTALLLPITPPGCERPVAILVAGVSSRLPLNESYRAFYDLIAAAVTSAVANARAHEEERRRAEALAEIDRAKTAFFSNVSHEFRTPLTLMLGPLEDELNERANPLPPERRQRLETAHRNSLRLLKLVNTLLDFSRIESGRIQASYEPVDLAAYTAELASVFRSAVEKNGLTLAVNCPPLPEPVYVDRDMWEKIVLNLISNALKHTFTGGIEVALRWGGDRAELSVTDSGIGIAEAELPRLFDRFHRVKGARSRTHEGSGIGLALVQELSRAHGGSVEVQSREGQGSTFIVTLKAGQAHLPAERIGTARTQNSTATGAAAYVEEALHWTSDPADVPTSEVSRAQPGPTTATEGLEAQPAPARSRILWVDDNADMRDYVARLLAPSYEVLPFADGAAALAAAQATPPDLVLSDIMMPGLDGFGLLRELRRDRRTQTIPVILLSARAGGELAIEGLEAGADDYLVKPFAARELLARVRTHLELAGMRRRWTLELEAANKELESFSYSISHDLRAPLRAINGFTHLVKNKCGAVLPPESQRHLQTVLASAARMNQLIDDLLQLARLGRKRVSGSAVDLTTLVHEVVEELRRTEPEQCPVVRVADLPEGLGDRSLLRQVFINLLSNAFKFSARQPQPLIEVGWTEQSKEKVYFVRDNGVGFDMRYASKLFGAFQRMHAVDEFPGTGVGLSIVQRIIARHGGRIWAEAEPGRGAIFSFTLSP
jgi:signal transduction histidine kinase